MKIFKSEIIEFHNEFYFKKDWVYWTQQFNNFILTIENGELKYKKNSDSHSWIIDFNEKRVFIKTLEDFKKNWIKIFKKITTSTRSDYDTCKQGIIDDYWLKWDFQITEISEWEDEKYINIEWEEVSFHPIKKILFISRHEMSWDMKKLLTEKLWKVSVDKVELIFTDGSEIKPFISKYDEFIVVAPNEVLQTIIELGIKPIQFKMTFRDENGKPLDKPRLLGLKRIISIQEEWM